MKKLNLKLLFGSYLNNNPLNNNNKVGCFVVGFGFCLFCCPPRQVFSLIPYCGSGRGNGEKNPEAYREDRGKTTIKSGLIILESGKVTNWLKRNFSTKFTVFHIFHSRCF